MLVAPRTSVGANAGTRPTIIGGRERGRVVRESHQREGTSISTMRRRPVAEMKKTNIDTTRPMLQSAVSRSPLAEIKQNEQLRKKDVDKRRPMLQSAVEYYATRRTHTIARDQLL